MSEVIKLSSRCRGYVTQCSLMDRFQCFGAGIPKLGVAGTFFMSRIAEVKTKIASRQCKTSTTGATTIDKYI